MILGSAESPHLAHILKRQTSKFQRMELRLLKKLDPHMTSGPDQLKHIVLQTLHKELAPILQVTFQRSIDQTKLASIWKEANVSQIFKKGDKTDPANYRSISLTCVLFKVLEHIVASNSSKHFTNQNIGMGSERTGPVRPS